MSQMIKNAMAAAKQFKLDAEVDPSKHKLIDAAFKSACRQCAKRIEQGERFAYYFNEANKHKALCMSCYTNNALIAHEKPNPELEINMTELESLLNSLGYKQLVELYKGVAGKTFGFNYAVAPQTAKKSDMIQYLIKELDAAKLDAGARAILRGDFKAAVDKGPGGELPPEHADNLKADGIQKGKGENAEQGEAEGEGDGDGQDDGEKPGKAGKGKGNGKPQGKGKDKAEGEGEGEDDDDALLRKIVQRGGGITEDRVVELIEEHAPKHAPARKVELEIKTPNTPEGVKLEDSTHPLFEKVLRLAAAGINVMLKGPAGCGKTHMAGQIAKALNKPFGHISGSAGASESQLVGRLLPTGDGGKFEYHQSPFIDMYENNGVFLFDEMDAFDPNTLLVVNTATANGSFMVEARSAKPHITRGEGSVLLAAVNTFGTGADAQYVGRFALDAATLDRWYIIELDYDQSYEASLFGGEPKDARVQWKPALKPSPAELKALGDWVWNVREKAKANGLRRIVSTRMIQKAVAARIAGIPAKEIQSDLLAGWTRDEKVKVGINA